jgi:hypothetical protein
MRMIAQAKTLQDTVEQQQTLTREMSHRVKNLLAITSGMVSTTGKTAATPKEMTDSVLGRLDALAQSHALIRRTAEIPEQRNGNLESAIETVLRPYDGACCATCGGLCKLRRTVNCRRSIHCDLRTAALCTWFYVERGVVQDGRRCACKSAH